MTTERFSTEQFLGALPQGSTDLGMRMGQHVFSVPIDPKVCVLVYSTIDSTGFAKDTAEDSIRFVLAESGSFDPIMVKLPNDYYTTRISGWERRVNTKIEVLRQFRSQAGDCPVCKSAKRIRIVEKPGPNKGKLYSSCKVFDHNAFSWIKDVRDSDYEEVPPQEEKKSFQPKKMVDHVDYSMLNPQQASIVNLLGKGPTVCAAGAGSGKTRVLAFDVANMIVNGIDPSKILVVTFSAKAAGEMRERIAKTLWPDISDEELAFYRGNASKEETEQLEAFDTSREWVEADPVRKFLADWVTTIHACCLRILKSVGEKPIVCKDRWERQANDLIKDSLAEFKWDQSPKNITTAIGAAVLKLVNPENSYSFFYEKYGSNVDQKHIQQLATIFSRYMRFMHKNNLVDFNMMQAEVYKRIKNPEFVSRLQSMFDYVIVDESQDTDDLQSDILWTIAGRTRNITFIGDTRQCVYRWRGAVPEVMDNIFDDKWGKSSVNRIGLPTNYRSNKTIVDQSNKMIRNNYLERLEYLFEAEAFNPDLGDPIEYIESKKFDGLVQEVSRLIIDSGSPEKWFVLSRTRAECAMIHLGLIRNKIPAVNFSGGLIFGALHIRKVLAYAQLACNYKESRNNIEVLKEVANVASDKFVAPITRRNHREGCSNDKGWVDCGCPVVMENGVDRCYTRYYANASIEEARDWKGIELQRYDKNRGGYPTMKARGADDLFTFVKELEPMVNDSRKCLRYIIEHSVFQWLAHEEGISQEDLGENGKQEDFDVILAMCEPDQTIEQYLAMIETLSSGGGSNKDAVHIMTVHRSKGLERPYVIFNVTRCPIIPPSSKPGDLIVSDPPSIEDERNIAYVAITRAKDKAVMVGSKEWNGKEVPTSQFVFEMDTKVPEAFLSKLPDDEMIDNMEDE
jgi:DNA helicase II / ATP-dependent DNA helicase PcrA